MSRRVTEWLIENPAHDADPQGNAFSDEEILEIQQLQTVARLVGLKRYEQPDLFFAQRNLACIHEAIGDVKNHPVRHVVSLWAALPWVRVGVGVACLFVIGLQVFSLSGLQPVTPLAHCPVREFHELPSLQLVSSTNDVPTTVPWPGSLGPESIEYGTGPSQLVEFEF